MTNKEIDAKGWMLVIACMMGVAICIIPVSVLTMGVFMKPLGVAFGWGRGQIALGLTILCLTMAGALPFSGRLIDRFGAKRPLVISLVLYAACIALLPFAIDNAGLPGLYIDMALTGIVGAPSSTVAYVKVLSGWFDRARGAALGVAMCGISVGASFEPLLAATTIGHYGWQTGFYVMALLPIVIGLPVALFVSEAPHVHSARSQFAGRPSLPGLTFPQAVRTRLFPMLFLLFLIAATAIHGIQIHLAPLLSDRGLAPQYAALGVTCMFIVSTAMRLVSGYLFDRVFAAWVGAACFFTSAIGTMLLVLSQSSTIGMVAVGLLGVGAGAESDLMAMLVSRYFGLRSFGTIYGATCSAFMIGSALGPLFLGLGFDASGSYASSLVWCTGGMLLTTILLLSLPRFPVWGATAVAGEDDAPTGMPAAVVTGTVLPSSLGV
jgi:MFS family permease